MILEVVRRPLLVSALLFCAGIAMQALPFGVGASIIGALLLYLLLRHRAARIVLLCLLFLPCGALRAAWVDRSAASLCSAFSGQFARISGTVISAPVSQNERTSFLLRTESIQSDTATHRTPIKLRIVLPDSQASPSVGNKIALTAQLSTPREADNAFGFDYRTFLKGQGVYLSGFTQEFRVLQSDARPPFSPRTLAQRCFDALQQNSAKIADKDARALYGALLLGDKRALSEETRATLTTAGLSHILSVSGMHLSICVTALLWFLRRLFGRRRGLRVLAIVFAIFMTMVVGASPATVRACTMCVLFHIALLLRQDDDGFSSLSLAALLMLAVQPFLLYSSGFLLSFSSTAGILLFARPLAERMARLPHLLADALAVTLSAQLFTVPIVMVSFGSLATYAALANVLCAPLIALFMITALCFAAFSWIAPLSAMAAAVLALLSRAILALSSLIARLPFATLRVASPSILFLVGYAAAVFALWLFLRKQRSDLRSIAVWTVALVWIVGTLYGVYDHSHLYLDFINVGQGDCALLRTPDSLAILIDGGGSTSYDVGKEVVGEYLYSRGISRVDYAFVSHFHNDHAGGILSLLRAGRVDTLVLPDDIPKASLYKSLVTAAQETGTRILYTQYGDRLQLRSGLILEAVAPIPHQGIANENTSQVLRLRFGDHTVLFSGDTELSDAEVLLHSGVNLDCTILKVPHHGSADAFSEKFLEATSPQFAVFTTTNGTVLPNGAVVDAYNAYGARVLRSDVCGTISFRLSKRRIHLTTSKEEPTS